jgi:hypothetical protein
MIWRTHPRRQNRAQDPLQIFDEESVNWSTKGAMPISSIESARH